jgi:putative transcriptional regulator
MVAEGVERHGKMRSHRSSSPAAVVGKRIRQLRIERELTQTNLARQIGIQQSDLSRMEKGEYRVSLDVLFRILRVLDLSLNDFFGSPAARDLTRREETLLNVFRALPQEEQDEVVEFAAFKRSRLEGADG